MAEMYHAKQNIQCFSKFIEKQKAACLNYKSLIPIGPSIGINLLVSKDIPFEILKHLNSV